MFWFKHIGLGNCPFFGDRWENVEPLSQIDRDRKLTLDPLRSLEMLHQKDREIVLIIITDNPSVELAVVCMKQGATDYLLNQQLAQLGATIKQVWQRKISSQQQSTPTH